MSVKALELMLNAVAFRFTNGGINLLDRSVSSLTLAKF
jgi:hypothetical protein